MVCYSQTVSPTKPRLSYKHCQPPVQLCPAGLLTFLWALESLKQCVCFSLKRKTVRPEERRIEILPFKLQSQGQEVKPAASWNTDTHTHTLSIYCLFKACSLTLILNIWSFTKLQSLNPASVFIFLCACVCVRCVSLKSLSVATLDQLYLLLIQVLLVYLLKNIIITKSRGLTVILCL